ncbi:MAG: hypothetical protein KJ060_02765, partial [Candidatus Hydrogenedentes bacterium]|nr:hypothetical protein [Candidatus Hydrogenedentota bacterium]
PGESMNHLNAPQTHKILIEYDLASISDRACLKPKRVTLSPIRRLRRFSWVIRAAIYGQTWGYRRVDRQRSDL